MGINLLQVANCQKAERKWLLLAIAHCDMVITGAPLNAVYKQYKFVQKAQDEMERQWLI